MIKKILFLLSLSGILSANCCNNCPCVPCGSDCGGWYGSVGAGYAWSFRTHIKNPDRVFWDNVAEGYDAHVGNAPFFTIGFGKEFCRMWALDLSYTYFQTFHYQKYQRSLEVIGRTRTRYFDFDPLNVMLNLSFVPRDCFSCSFCCLDFMPVLGIGIGVGVNRVSNFRSVVFNPSTTTFVGSTTAIGFERTTTSFAWQGTAGLRMSPSCSPLNIDILYRYYDGGRFHGPSRIVANDADDLGGFVSGKAWKGRFRANELILSLSYLF